MHARDPRVSGTHRPLGAGPAAALRAVAALPEEGDKDAPLRDDLRLLGRILGEVTCDQAGEAVFDLVESTRREAITARRWSA
jgi:phosphoenolpyruvate carboxylase